MSISRVAVYLGSKTGNSPMFVECAFELGKQLAQNGIGIVYGGTNIGTMNALANGATSVGGNITGVIPEMFVNKSFTYDNLTKLIVTKDIKERKQIMEELSDAAIIMPGGYGTMDELFEYAVNNQLGQLNRPIIVFNTDGFYTPIISLLDNMEKTGFLPSELRSMFIFCDSVKKIVKQLQ